MYGALGNCVNHKNISNTLISRVSVHSAIWQCNSQVIPPFGNVTHRSWENYLSQSKLINFSTQLMKEVKKHSNGNPMTLKCRQPEKKIVAKMFMINLYLYKIGNLLIDWLKYWYKTGNLFLHLQSLCHSEVAQLRVYLVLRTTILKASDFTPQVRLQLYQLFKDKLAELLTSKITSNVISIIFWSEFKWKKHVYEKANP